ncbi:MAG: hypothetical protein GY953_48935, partial [bacterium]|nr:hypothetical protein [bacterium]
MRPLLILLLLASGLPAAGDWLRLSSPHFEIFTDAGEKKGLRAMVHFEQVRQVFRDVGGEHQSSPLPVRIYLFKKLSDFRRYRPSANTRGFFRGGPEANYIVMHAGGEETWRVAFHEYVHLVLNHTSARLPQWLEEGTAEFYSTVRPVDDRLVIGGIIRNHVILLRQRAWLKAAVLADIGHDSPAYNERARAGVFYAQSWALVHMLNMAPYYRRGMPRYAELIAEATPAAEAFQRAFGRTLGQALGE